MVEEFVVNELGAEQLRTTGDGGAGFCYDIDPEVFWSPAARQQIDGPLIIALDTNVLIDLQTHGGSLLEGNLPAEIPEASEYGRNLQALGDLIEIWFLRDIRFIPFHRAASDFRTPPSPDRQQNRELALSQLAACLAFQFDDWEWDWMRATSEKEQSSAISGGSIPGLADRELVNAAQTLGVDVFVTNDKRVLRGASYPDVRINIWSPLRLMERLSTWDAGPFSGGFVQHPNCLYSQGLPAGDTGKWVSLLELIGN